MKKDYYNILNVEKNASDEDIKKSFRKLSLKYHPDKQQGKSEAEVKEAEEKFKEIAEAYSILSDKEKRQHYDTFGTVDGMGGFGSGGMDINDIMAEFMHSSGFGSHFSSFHKQPTYKGSDKVLKINVTLSEVYNRVTKTVRYKVDRPCKTCGGSGSKTNKTETCPYCHGTGMLTQTYQQGNMFTQSSRPCHYCNGTGIYIKDKCKDCGGTGVVSTTEELTVQVPLLDKLNTTYYKKSAGNSCAMNRGVNGDLRFTYTLSMDDEFSLDEANPINIIKSVEVPVLECITGTKIKITHMDGKQYDVDIKECTKDGQIYTIKNKGFTTSNGYRGDLLIKVISKMPKSVTKEELKIINKLKKSDSFK